MPPDGKKLPEATRQTAAPKTAEAPTQQPATKSDAASAGALQRMQQLDQQHHAVAQQSTERRDDLKLSLNQPQTTPAVDTNAPTTQQSAQQSTQPSSSPTTPATSPTAGQEKSATKPPERADQHLASFNIQEFFKDPIGNFLKLIKSIFGKFSLAAGVEGIADLLQSIWKDAPPEERDSIQKLFDAAKKYLPKTTNIEKLFQSQEETRRVFAQRKADGKDSETWEAWLARHLSENERTNLAGSTTLDAKAIADMLISANTAQDVPAKLLAVAGATAHSEQRVNTQKAGNANEVLRQIEARNPGFIAKVTEIAAKVGCETRDLLYILWKESEFNTQAVNAQPGDSPDAFTRARIRATGLLQFIPPTAKGLGTTTQEIFNMSPMEQLEYVDRFFKNWYGRLHNYCDLYMVVFCSDGLGKPDDYILGSSSKDPNWPKRIAQQNGGMGRGKDYVTVADFRAYAGQPPADLGNI